MKVDFYISLETNVARSVAATRGQVIAIVGIAGATETGSVDDLNALADAWARSDKGRLMAG